MCVCVCERVCVCVCVCERVCVCVCSMVSDLLLNTEETIVATSSGRLTGRAKLQNLLNLPDLLQLQPINMSVCLSVCLWVEFLCVGVCGSVHVFICHAGVRMYVCVCVCVSHASISHRTPEIT